MKSFRLIVAFVLFPFVLTACQTAQTGSSSFAGAALIGDPVKQSEPKKAAKVRKPKTFANEAASLIVKPEDRKKKTTAQKTAFPKNEAASLIVKKKKPKATVKVRQGSDATKRVAAVKKKKSKRSSKGPSSRKRYRNIIAKHARANGVPLRLAMAVVQVESNFRANARGQAGEIGLMQLMPRTARFIGYKGKLKHLYNPDTNIRYGMKYLGKAYRLGKGSTCGTILKYNAGHGAKRMNPISRKYCKRVRRILRNG